MHAWDDQQSFQHLARYGPGEPSMHPNLIMVRPIPFLSAQQAEAHRRTIPFRAEASCASAISM